MEWTKILSVVSVVLVILWSAGATVELFVTTFSIGPHVTPAAATVVVLTVVLIATIAVGARSRSWLKNPDSYW